MPTTRDNSQKMGVSHKGCLPMCCWEAAVWPVQLLARMLWRLKYLVCKMSEPRTLNNDDDDKDKMTCDVIIISPNRKLTWICRALQSRTWMDSLTIAEFVLESITSNFSWIGRFNWGYLTFHIISIDDTNRSWFFFCSSRRSRMLNNESIAMATLGDDDNILKERFIADCCIEKTMMTSYARHQTDLDQVDGYPSLPPHTFVDSVYTSLPTQPYETSSYATAQHPQQQGYTSLLRHQLSHVDQNIHKTYYFTMDSKDQSKTRQQHNLSWPRFHKLLYTNTLSLRPRACLHLPWLAVFNERSGNGRSLSTRQCIGQRLYRWKTWMADGRWKTLSISLWLKLLWSTVRRKKNYVNCVNFTKRQFFGILYSILSAENVNNDWDFPCSYK